MSMNFLIESPKHFTELLASSQDAVRLGALRLLADGHADALDFARTEAASAIAVLSGQLESSASNDEDKLLLRALGALDDPRAASELVRVLMYSSDTEALDLAAASLARWDEREPNALRQTLYDRHRPHLRELAARHLDGAHLAESDVIRGALIRLQKGAIDATEVPRLTSEKSLSAFLSELAGPYSAEAREALSAQGTLAFEQLASASGQLHELNFHWLIAWAGELGSLPALNFLDHLLAAPSVERPTLLLTLASTARLGTMARTLSERLDALYRLHLNTEDAELLAAIQLACRAAEVPA